MENLLPQSNKYIMSSLTAGSFIKMDLPAGYLQIADSFCVSVKTKPSEEHLQNMYNTFGWVWVEHVS